MSALYQVHPLGMEEYDVIKDTCGSCLCAACTMEKMTLVKYPQKLTQHCSVGMCMCCVWRKMDQFNRGSQENLGGMSDMKSGGTIG